MGLANYKQILKGSGNLGVHMLTEHKNTVCIEHKKKGANIVSEICQCLVKKKKMECQKHII